MSVPAFSDIPEDINQRIAAHIELYLKDPGAAHMWDARPVGLSGKVPTLLLTTVGRKSGEPRHVPLLYVDDGDGYLIVGSKGGNSHHPVWFLNLQANPRCQVRVGAPPVNAVARVLEGDAYASAWQNVSARYPTYAKYQSRTDRKIPVIRLKPE